jgi:hypothetical protein
MSPRLSFKFETETIPLCMALTEKYVFLAGIWGLIFVFDIKELALIGVSTSTSFRTIQAGQLFSVAALGSTLCVGNSDGIVRLWRITDANMYVYYHPLIPVYKTHYT